MSHWWLCYALMIGSGWPLSVYAQEIQTEFRHLSIGWSETGIASVYASKFQGRRTASGEPYNSQALTAAHPSLPFGSLVRVTSLSNGKTVVVRINDRGPFVEGRVIDVSRAAAKVLRLRGLMQIEIEQLR